MFFFSSPGNMMNAAIAKFMQAFPEMSQSTIMLVITLPSLISMPVMLFIGSIVGKKVNYKTIAVLAPLLTIIGGVGPYFFSSNW